MSRLQFNEGVLEEVEALTAIFMDEVSVTPVDHGAYIRTIVEPMTGNNVQEQYVCITLEAMLDNEYPKTKPVIKLSNPRGLDDSVLQLMKEQIDELLNNCSGTAIVYQVIQLVRDILTKYNLPNTKCPICLYFFFVGDLFIRTSCFHHYHSICVKEHIVASREIYEEKVEALPEWQRSQAPPFQQLCAVCRSVIDDVTLEENPPPPVESLNEPPISICPEIRALQATMEALRQYQASKGGQIEQGDNGPPPLNITDTPTIYGPSTSRAAIAMEAAATANRSDSGTNNNNNKKNGGQKQSPAKKNGNQSNNNNNSGRKNGEPAQNSGQAPEPPKTPTKVPYRGFNRNNRGRGRKGNGGTR